MEYAKAVQALCDGGVDFVIIGELAACFHGSERLTIVLEICYSRQPVNLERLARTLQPLHPCSRDLSSELHSVWDEVALRQRDDHRLSTDVGCIDLVAVVPGVGAYNDALARSINLQAFDREVTTLDLGALMDSKRAGRPKDLLVLRELEALGPA